MTDVIDCLCCTHNFWYWAPKFCAYVVHTASDIRHQSSVPVLYTQPLILGIKVMCLCCTHSLWYRAPKFCAHLVHTASDIGHQSSMPALYTSPLILGTKVLCLCCIHCLFDIGHQSSALSHPRNKLCAQSPKEQALCSATQETSSVLSHPRNKMREAAWTVVWAVTPDPVFTAQSC